ncbi:MAG: ATP phosphoribosyltransferase regulatory subunit, partial [Pseudanabaenaceae cyanobacterium]
YQAGGELLGCGGAVADGEILLLLAQGLARIELTDWQVLLGHAGLTAQLLTVFPPDQRAAVRRCLARLDRVGLLALPLPAPWQERAIALLELRGTPESVFARLTDWVTAVGGDLAAAVAAERERLAFLVELWQNAGPGDRLYLDLSTIETFDYYTGIVFQVVSGNAVVGRGGRYDRLLGLYHPQGKTYPGIGFCLHLEELQKALQAVLPQQTLVPRWVIVPSTAADIPQAFARAAAIRQDRLDTVVEVYVDRHPPDTVRQRARARGIPRLVWVTGDTFCVESLVDG